MKRTKGEWYLFEAGLQTPTDKVIIQSKKLETIAHLIADDLSKGEGSSKKIRHENMMANAKLMVAAPKLLEALQNVLFHIEDGSLMHTEDEAFKNQSIEEIKEAIKKATDK